MNSGKTWRSRILVVDDEQLIALTLSAILDAAKYQVATAFSGEEAAEMAAIFRPHLLLTDISMGAMNGMDAAVQIRATQPDCKVLFLSGHDSMCQTLKSPPANLVYGFMSKPARIPDLLNAIAYMLPAASAGSDQAVFEIESDPMQLRNLARTALARLDACRGERSSWSGAGLEGRSASSVIEGRIELAGHPSVNTACEKQWFAPRRGPAVDEQRTRMSVRAASLA